MLRISTADKSYTCPSIILEKVSFPVSWGGGSVAHLTWLLGPYESHPNNISIRSSVFARLMLVINRRTGKHTDRHTGRHTDSPRYTCNNTPHLTPCMLPSKNLKKRRIGFESIVLNCNSSLRYDTIRDAILTCARKPT